MTAFVCESVCFLVSSNDCSWPMSASTVRGSTRWPLTSMRETGIDTSQHGSKPLDCFLGQSFDYVITVCDRARDNCPTFPGDTTRIHWGFKDPAAATRTPAQQLAVFRRVRNEIVDRLRLWVAVQRRHLTPPNRRARHLLGNAPTG